MKKYQNILSTTQLVKDKSLLQDEEIKKQIRILPELEGLIPPLRGEEFEQLSANIRSEGCREALLVWHRMPEDEYILVDGHNRYAICQQFQIAFRIHQVQFTDLEEVRMFMINNQLGRRNLSPEQASYLRGMRYQQEKMDKGKYDREHKAQNGPYEKRPTSERLAEEFNVSKNTIKRDAVFAEGLEKIGQLNPALKKDILSGKVKVNKSDVQRWAQQAVTEVPQSPEDVARLVALPPPQAKTTALPAPEENIQAIKQTILTLSRQLSTEEKAVAPLCDSLIEALRKLKAHYASKAE
jgi:hypothetical protein